MTRRAPVARAALAVGLALASALACAAQARAQELRGSVRAIASYIELVPLRQDTVDRAVAILDADGRLVFEGHPLTCTLVDRCTYYLSDDVVSGAALAQDVTLTAWGLGVTGLNVTAFARTRQEVGGEFVVPRSDDRFDLLLGYAELVRDRWRARVGRMRNNAGLGFSGYDGTEVQVRALETLRITAYAGRSLAPGLEDTREDALDPIESFVPDRDSWLFGSAVAWQAEPATGVELRYQRDLLSDRSVLLSERASLDARTGRWEPLVVELSADYDVALSRAGKARLSLTMPVTSALTVQASGRRYVPYFELWTIWGYFSPVAYHEVELDAAYAFGADLHARAGVAYRKYEDAHAPLVLSPLEDDAVRATLGAVAARCPLTLSATYRLDRASGAFFSGADAELRWRALERLELGALASATQQIMEFRLGDERIYGAGASLRWHAHERATLSGGAALYAHQVGNRPATGDWDQRRAWVALTVGFGSEPGSGEGIVPAAPLPAGYFPADPPPAPAAAPEATP